MGQVLKRFSRRQGVREIRRSKYDIPVTELLPGVPESQRDKVLLRRGYIEEFYRLVASGLDVDRAIAACCETHKLRVFSLRNWVSRYRKLGMIGLVDSNSEAVRF
ncbi:MAG: hypothetical protein JXD22_04940 [Sedimentisphaerales bacterium]|nr:hypothetical protein [Sedimentisphaerales bacterium]